MNRTFTFSRWLALIPILACVLVGPARAQEGSGSVSGATHPTVILADDTADSIPPASPMPKLKSENAAFAYSLAGTLMPMATIVLAGPGLIIGPSMGYFYGGMPGRAWTGIGIRVLGVGGMASSFIICGWDCGPGRSGYNEAWAVFLASAGVVTVSAIYDIATVKTAVRNHNNALMKLGDTITPVYFPDSRAFGLKFAYRF